MKKKSSESLPWQNPIILIIMPYRLYDGRLQVPSSPIMAPRGPSKPYNSPQRPQIGPYGPNIGPLQVLYWSSTSPILVIYRPRIGHLQTPYWPYRPNNDPNRSHIDHLYTTYWSQQAPIWSLNTQYWSSTGPILVPRDLTLPYCFYQPHTGFLEISYWSLHAIY